MIYARRVWLARLAAGLICLCWWQAFNASAYGSCSAQHLLSQPSCIWVDGSYAGLGEPFGGGFDTVSSVAWLANILTIIAVVRLAAGRVPSAPIAIAALGLALLELIPRTNHASGYVISLVHGGGYWLWLTGNAIPAATWLALRFGFVDPRQAER